MSKYHEPWSQGVLLETTRTKQWPVSEKIKANEMEKKQVFCHFSSQDQGRSRQGIAITNDPLIARRIALCVNACEGITNEALEQGIVQAGLDAMKLEHLNGKAIFVDVIPELKTFMGVKIWEDEV